MSCESLALFGGEAAIPPGAHRRWPLIEQEEERAVLDVLRSGVLSGPDAPASKSFEKRFAAFCGTEFAQLTASGTSALQIALAAAGVGADDEVIVPAYSYIATPLAVLQLGAVPIFVDVSAPHWTIDPRRVEAAISPRTKAILPVHIHGTPADMDELAAIAPRRGLIVIEDAAQAHGAAYKGRPAGSLSDAAAFSLQSSKNIGAGEGGVFVTSDAALAEKANQFRNFGCKPRAAAQPYDPLRPLDDQGGADFATAGGMFRGNEIVAALAEEQLQKLSDRIRECRANAQRLSAALAELPGVFPPAETPDRASAFHKYRVRLDPAAAGLSTGKHTLRKSAQRALRAEGLEVVEWETKPLVAYSLFSHRNADSLRRADPKRLSDNYDVDAYPTAVDLLDSSIVLFSQSYPLIAQTSSLIDQYAEAFHKVWRKRRTWAAAE